MGNRLMVSILAAVAMAAFSAVITTPAHLSRLAVDRNGPGIPVVLAQSTQQPGAAKAQASKSAPDLSGVWGSATWDTLGSKSQRAAMSSKPGAPRGMAVGDVLFTPWGKRQYEYQKDQFVPPQANERGRNELDPSSHCFPDGPTRLMSDTNPFEIIQSARRVMIFSETNHEVRQIWTDGRQHPKDLDVTWNGHSIGKWDGDALVADTIGMHEETWLDGAGRGPSDKLHLVERFRRLDHDTLQIDMTIDDPKAYTKPFTVQIVRKLRPDWDIAETVTCDERYRRGIYFGEGPGGL